jgi:hypothetical protein
MAKEIMLIGFFTALYLLLPLVAFAQDSGRTAVSNTPVSLIPADIDFHAARAQPRRPSAERSIRARRQGRGFACPCRRLLPSGRHVRPHHRGSRQGHCRALVGGEDRLERPCPRRHALDRCRGSTDLRSRSRDGLRRHVTGTGERYGGHGQPNALAKASESATEPSAPPSTLTDSRAQACRPGSTAPQQSASRRDW